ncbi:MAG: hypothetical protein KU37_07975 [Sulfuricurvum sp. PC08-66]|nr:MAG: hypothetical protein KU37_07975 [Sulfuricurvum sp. PC08-66]
MQTTLTFSLAPSFEVEPHSAELIGHWICLFILELGGQNEFFGRNGFDSVKVARYLGMKQSIETYDFNHVKHYIEALKRLANTLKNGAHFGNEVLEKNLQKLCHFIDLKPVEIDILRFALYVHNYNVLDDAGELLSETSTMAMYYYLSVLLGYPSSAIKEALKSSGTLAQKSLLRVEQKDRSRLRHKLELASDGFAQRMMHSDEGIETMLSDVIRPCDTSHLMLEDFVHITSTLEVLLAYLGDAMRHQKRGVNVLLYGRPGTGKTELVKVIAHALQAELFEVAYENEEHEPIGGIERYKAYLTAQSLLQHKNVLVMFDEIEDIFREESEPSHMSRRNSARQYKASFNRTLETNALPTIWVSNSVHAIDDAIIRRFDIVLEMPVPPHSRRKAIIESHAQTLLAPSTVEKIAQNPHATPAIVTRATKVIHAVKANISQIDQAYEMLVSGTLKAQGFATIKTHKSTPPLYDPALISTSIDTVQLVEGIRTSGKARLCLYGVPGTGKSAFGHYIAQALDAPFLLKKGSELISKWVGETEQNIADAFAEAKSSKAVLVFDEIDSFLRDRRDARASWEVTQVNEMLVQMEEFEGIFIATTNLIDNLDQASLRRFNLKLEFGYLSSDNVLLLFARYAHFLGLDTPTPQLLQQLRTLTHLTPGDFDAVYRQHSFMPLHNCDTFYARLLEEVRLKERTHPRKVGFAV